jgi:magnesium-transporting ATPase (P-type)
MDTVGSVRPTATDLAALPVDRVWAALDTGPEGLTAVEAAARLLTDGPNRLPAPVRGGALRRLIAQMTHFFAALLWAAAVLAWVGGMPALAVAIAIVVVVNGVFSFVQEERAERATEALGELLPARARVVRDGHRLEFPAQDLVRGDLVVLREGDRISADARLIRTDGLMVDRSTLTGESVPVARHATPTGEPIDHPMEASDLVFAGTYVTSGSGRALVYDTGSRTLLGGIARLTSGVVRRTTPLQLDLDRAVRIIAAFAITAGVAFFGVSLLLGMPSRDGFLFSIGVIVALVPEGLLPTLTLSLAMSATRMSRRGALVRHLESVETLGATTVICSDKTGTMTTNQMTARMAWMHRHILRATHSGWAPGGTLLEDERPLGRETIAEAEPLFAAAALCGNARLITKDGRTACVGDPTEGALCVFAAKGGVERHASERATPRVREFPFESDRMRMTTVHRRSDGTLVGYTKGSPEAVLAASTILRTTEGDEPLDDGARTEVIAAVDRMAADGLRVLGLAVREHGHVLPEHDHDAERDLVFTGLVGLQDPVRPEVPEAIDRCRDAGIRVVMITGDHPRTAEAVAARVGLPSTRVVLGPELPSDEASLGDILADPAVSVLARVAPEQKLRIARSLQSLGAVVAMTGDGVNDAPALRQADIGVAMGVAGTDVAREAADLILLDDDFTHIVEAIEEGRAAFDNIRRFLTYHLTDNVAELAPFAIWALTAGAIPLMLSVLQVLALDIGTDLLPALALGAERPEPGVMDRPPRRLDEHLLSGHVLARAFGFLGPIEAVCSMAMLPIGAALLYGWQLGEPLPAGTDAHGTLSAAVFSAIVLMQMANAYACRSDPVSLARLGPVSNRLLNLAVGIEFLALLVFVYVPPVADVLGGRPLPALMWVPIAVTPFVLLGAEEARKAVVRARARGRPHTPTPRAPIRC